jgi:integrase
MNRMQPIRKQEHIVKMEEAFMKQSYRNYILFKLGINCGLRISDLLTVKVKTVLQYTHILMKEQKTKKDKRFLINDQLKKELITYIKKEGLTDEDFLFKSRNKNVKPVTICEFLEEINYILKLKAINIEPIKKNSVQNIKLLKNKEKFNAIMKELREGFFVFYVLFMTYCCSNYELDDLLSIKVKDLSKYEFNNEIIELIKTHTIDMCEDEYVFKICAGDIKPIGRKQAHTIISETAKKTCRLKEIGCHSLRKTFGYWYYQRTKDIATLQIIFGHEHPSVTLRYIGITDDMIDDSLREFYL